MSVLARRKAAARESADVGVGALFDEHAPMVLTICRYLLRDAQAAEDAAQETFLSAHRSLLGGTQPRDPPAWLATIARNECRRMWRTARPVPLDEATTGTLLDPADIFADRAEVSEVASAIGKLPPRQREALVLREFCGLSYEQVAAAMSVSEPVVDSLLSRARRGLSERVGYVPRAARGALVVPASLREELARLIPGLDPAGAATAAGVASGAGGAATLASLGSAPVAAKLAATGVAAVALAVPMQATLRGEESRRASERPPAAAQEAGPAVPRPAARVAPAAAERPDPRPAGAGSTPRRAKQADADNSGRGSTPNAEPEQDDSSGPGPGVGSRSTGSGSSGSSSSGPGSGSTSSGTDSSGPGPGTSSGSGGSGSGSSGSGSSGSGSSGPGSGGVVAVADGSSGSSGSGSSGSGSASSGSDSSGSESSGSGSGDPGSTDSGSTDSGSTDSGSSGSDSSGSDSSGSGSGGSGSEAD